MGRRSAGRRRWFPTRPLPRQSRRRSSCGSWRRRRRPRAPAPRPGRCPRTSSPAGGSSTAGGLLGASFGAAQYHVQVARDAGLAQIVVEADTNTTVFTVPVDLATGTQYYWRVNGSNLCGASAYSAAATFLVGACSEGWSSVTDVPIPNGLQQSTAIAASNGSMYLIGGGTGFGPDTRIDQVWAYDPTTGGWARKADVPSPGVGSNFGFGGVGRRPHVRLRRDPRSARRHRRPPRALDLRRRGQLVEPRRRVADRQLRSRRRRNRRQDLPRVRLGILHPDLAVRSRDRHLYAPRGRAVRAANVAAPWREPERGAARLRGRLLGHVARHL